jgi:integrase
LPRLTNKTVLTLGPRIGRKGTIVAGRYQDTGTPGLYLYVSPDEQVRRWIFRFTSPDTKRTKKITETGLGPVSAVPVADARSKVADLRKQIARGICPIAAKKAERDAGTTFAEAAEAWIAVHSPSWRSETQLRGARRVLFQHGKPLGSVPVADISPDKIQSCLEELWVRCPVQARRALAMFERVLDYAKAKGLRVGDNPASWRGMHEYRFPKRNGGVKHYSALPYEQIPGFMKALRVRQSRSSGAVALELLILTACRTGEVLGMRWDEIDLVQRVWTIPAGRTKKNREHVVPLSDRVIELLKDQQLYSPGSEYVFTGWKRSRMTPKSLWSVLQAMKLDVTVHGFRSTFRDWAGDATDFSRESIEECLAHAVGNATERSYRSEHGIGKAKGDHGGVVRVLRLILFQNSSWNRIRSLVRKILGTLRFSV